MDSLKNFLILIVCCTITAYVWANLGYWYGYQMSTVSAQVVKPIPESEYMGTTDYYTKYMLEQCLIRERMAESK